MQIIQIGSVAILLKWVLLGLSVLFGLVLLKFWLKGLSKEENKKIFHLLTNTLFIGFIIWKGSLILFEPALVMKSFFSLLYFTGGSNGLVLAITVSIIFFIFKARRLSITYLIILQTIFIFGLGVTAAYQILFLIIDRNNYNHGLLVLTTIIMLLISLWSFLGVKGLYKKIWVLIGLFGLIGWADYKLQVSSHAHNNTIQESQPTGTHSLKSKIQEGNKAPDFELQTLTGKKIKLSHLAGKKVILNFWATWCPPCKAEMPNIQGFYDDQRGNGVEVFSVNLTSAEKDPNSVRKFVHEYGLTFPVVLDREGTIGEQYQAFTIPTSYIIDSKGIIRKKVIGPMDKEMMAELIKHID